MFDGLELGLEGRVAVVTGAGRGIGKSIVETLAAAGALVAVNDIDDERAATLVARIRGRGGRACTATADITDRGQVEVAMSAARQSLGPIDILVNNAGIPAAGVGLNPFLDVRPSEWDQMFGLNVNGLRHCVEAVLPSMVERGWGRLIAITSDSARTGEPRMSAYAASKAAAGGLIRSLAKEVGPAGVTCNSLSLGTVLPDSHEMPDDIHLEHARRYPMRRLGRPRDVAGAVLWLASDYGDWITGQTIPINGGYAAG